MRGDDGLMVVLTGVVLVIAVATLMPRDGSVERMLGLQRDIVVRDDTFRFYSSNIVRLDVTRNDIDVDFDKGDQLRITQRPECGLARVERDQIILSSIASCSGQLRLTYCVETGGACSPAQVTVAIDDRIAPQSAPPDISETPLALARPEQADPSDTTGPIDQVAMATRVTRPEEAASPGLDAPDATDTVTQSRTPSQPAEALPPRTAELPQPALRKAPEDDIDPSTTPGDTQTAPQPLQADPLPLQDRRETVPQPPERSVPDVSLAENGPTAPDIDGSLEASVRTPRGLGPADDDKTAAPRRPDPVRSQARLTAPDAAAPQAPSGLGETIRQGLAPPVSADVVAPSAISEPTGDKDPDSMRLATAPRQTATTPRPGQPARPTPSEPGVAPRAAPSEPGPAPTLPAAAAVAAPTMGDPVPPSPERLEGLQARAAPQSMETPYRPDVALAPRTLDAARTETSPDTRQVSRLARRLDPVSSQPVQPLPLAGLRDRSAFAVPSPPPAPEPDSRDPRPRTPATLQSVAQAGLQQLQPPGDLPNPDRLAPPAQLDRDQGEPRFAALLPAERPGVSPTPPPTDSADAVAEVAVLSVRPAAAHPIQRPRPPEKLGVERPIPVAPPVLSFTPVAGLKDTPRPSDGPPLLPSDPVMPRVQASTDAPERPSTPVRPNADAAAAAVAIRLPGSQRAVPAPTGSRVTVSGIPPAGPQTPQPAALAVTVPDPTPTGVAPRALAACRPTLSMSVARGQMIDLAIDAACLAGEALTVDHSGLRFSHRLDDSGAAVLTLPALAAEARVTVLYGNGEAVARSIAVPGMDSIARAAVVWSGDFDLNLHLFAPGLRNGADHVWQGAARNFREARLGGGGFHLTLGDPDLGLYRAEVISVPLRRSGQPAVMRLELELASASPACLEAIDFSTVWADARRRSEPQAIRLPFADCPRPGEMLRNVGLRDLVLARR